MKDKKPKCNLHILPQQITDEDISSLFYGLLNIIKKKIELENRQELISANMSISKLLGELKQKNSEIVRLKNQILYLQQQSKNPQT